MNSGYFLLLLLGVCWTLIAITLSEAKSKNCNIFAFYCIGSFVAALLLFAVGGFSILTEVTLHEKKVAGIYFVAGSILNGSGQAMTMWNLKKGGRALAYAIPQLSFLMPFVWSFFFWSQQLSINSCGGIFLIVIATLFLSISKHSGTNSSLEPKRVLFSVIAMMLLGTSQILLITPTQFPAAKALSPLCGTWLILISNAIFFLLLLLFRSKNDHPCFMPAIKYGFFWGILATCAYCVLLPALRILGSHGQSGIVFAVGCGMTIALFTLFTVIRYREKQSIKQIIAFVAIIVGIFLAKI